jgi:alkyl hydroperoxide reductase 1
MPELKIGDSFPEGVTFGYIPIDGENSDFSSCGVPQKFNASEGMLS